MSDELINKVSSSYKKMKHPDFKVGDIIEVHTRIKEDKKERVQVFTGIVIAIKGKGISKTFTIRKISYGIGVEKIFPFYAPVIAKIKIIKRGTKVRRSKLYYLRKRKGKTAMRAGAQVPAEGEDLETVFFDEMEKTDIDKVEEKPEEKENETEKETKNEDEKTDK